MLLRVFIISLAFVSTIATSTMSANGVILCETKKKFIILRQTGDSPHEVAIGVLDNGPIAVRNQPYSSRNTVVLFATLKKLLADLSKREKCAGIQANQFSTRAYKKRTILAFDFGDNIVELDTLSNGPKDEERLYTLDLVSRKDSFFWGKL
jgi:hypothetical protein